MDYMHGISQALTEPALRWIFIGFLWLLVAAIAFVAVIIIWQFLAKLSSAKHSADSAKNSKTHIPEAFVLIIVIAAFLAAGVWLLRQNLLQ